MKVSEAIIRCLEEEKIKNIFGYPGAAVLDIYEDLRKSKIEHILTKHEQAAGHCASGYSRSACEVGVCIATSGPGATNLITAIATAYMDSIPMVIITGQVKTSNIGKDSFQEADIFGATESFTKHNYLVKDKEEIPRVFKEAFYIAKTGRPGPVLIDIPLDIQKMQIDFVYPKEINIRGYKPTVNGNKRQIIRAIERIKKSKKPIICVGGGIFLSNAEKEFREFVDKTGIPVVHTLMGKGCIPDTNESYIGLIGSHGTKIANKSMSESDLVIIIGARVGDRAVTSIEDINKSKDIIHIDIDPAELGKNLEFSIPIVGDAKEVIRDINKEIDSINIEDWLAAIKLNKNNINKQIELNEKKSIKGKEGVNPKEVLKKLSKYIPKDTIITADVGQNQIWAARNIDMKEDMKFLTSGGLGTMGYSIPAAIGAKLANSNKMVISIFGDGSFQMSLAELGTILEYDIDIKMILFNNTGLGMVREIQNKMFNDNYGVNVKNMPNFIKLVEAYGIETLKVTESDKVDESLERIINSKGAIFVEYKVDRGVSTL
ncbi:biosynthetic-type acetolactate synthase large subunit [Clostridium sp. DL1XJH146]